MVGTKDNKSKILTAYIVLQASSKCSGVSLQSVGCGIGCLEWQRACLLGGWHILRILGFQFVLEKMLIPTRLTEMKNSNNNICILHTTYNLLMLLRLSSVEGLCEASEASTAHRVCPDNGHLYVRSSTSQSPSSSPMAYKKAAIAGSQHARCMGDVFLD